MSFSLVPDYSFCRVTDILPDFLKSQGIRFLMMDLDNTIAPYGQNMLSENVLRWAEAVVESGVELYFVSNSKKYGRVEHFADSLKNIGYIKAAGKPSPKGVLAAMSAAGRTKKESALVGDQVFTDVLAANNGSVTSICVKPIKFTNPFLAIRYFFEIPFRAMCKNKMERIAHE